MIVPPRFAAYPRCEDAIWRAVQQAMVGAWSPEQAVARAADEIQRIIGCGVNGARQTLREDERAAALQHGASERVAAQSSCVGPSFAGPAIVR